jgi:hypothetical protein
MRDIFLAFSRRSADFPGLESFERDYAGLAADMQRPDPVTLAMVRLCADQDDPHARLGGGSEALARSAVARSVDVPPEDVSLNKNGETLTLRCSKGDGSVLPNDLAAYLGNTCYGSIAAPAPGDPLPLPAGFARDARKYCPMVKVKQGFNYTRRDWGSQPSRLAPGTEIFLTSRSWRRWKRAVL